EAPVRELFRPLVSQPKDKKGKTKPLGPVPVLPPGGAKTTASSTTTTTPTPATPAAPAGPSVSDVQMLGIVEVGDEVKALLKKTSTGESRYFAKGEDAFGFKVDQIKSDEVTLTHNGKTDRVAMSNQVPIEGTSGGATTMAAGGFSSRFGGRFG